jgi:hypothetical protein
MIRLEEVNGRNHSNSEALNYECYNIVINLDESEKQTLVC